MTSAASCHQCRHDTYNDKYQRKPMNGMQEAQVLLQKLHLKLHHGLLERSSGIIHGHAL